MTATERQKVQTAAVLLAVLAPLLIVSGSPETVPLTGVGITIVAFKTAGYLFVGLLTGYVLFTILRGENE